MLSKMRFYVYTHARPDGTVFYVGKGVLKRTIDFNPSRRSLHHINIVNKYGRKNIIVVRYEQPDEETAFQEEVKLISKLRNEGVDLINLTDGGEGATGRKLSDEVRDKIRRSVVDSYHKRNVTEDSLRRSHEGQRKGVAAMAAWKLTPEGQAHLKKLSSFGAESWKARPFREVKCVVCGSTFQSKSPRAKACSKACQLRSWRADQKAKASAQPPKVYSNNTTGARGVYFIKRTGKWSAMITVDKKNHFLGYFNEKQDAIDARKEAEKRLYIIEKVTHN